MSDPPVVISSKRQKITGSGTRRSVTGTKPTSHPPEGLPGAIDVGQINATYQNVRICMARSPESAVEAMADTGQFLVSAGYAKINTVEVPQRRGIAVFAGFDPVTATLPIIMDRLGVFDENGNPVFDVEEACAMLEYMAGQGYGPGSGKYEGAAQQGGVPKPVIVESLLAPTPQGGVPKGSHLIPANYNAAIGQHHPPAEWYITGLQWGDSIRSSQPPYQRVRQKVTLTFTEYDHEATTTTGAAAIPVKWINYKVGRGKSGKGESPYEIVRLHLHWPKHEADQRAKEVQKRWNQTHHGKQRLGTFNSLIKMGQTIKVPVEA